MLFQGIIEDILDFDELLQRSNPLLIHDAPITLNAQQTVTKLVSDSRQIGDTLLLLMEKKLEEFWQVLSYTKVYHRETGEEQYFNSLQVNIADEVVLIAKYKLNQLVVLLKLFIPSVQKLKVLFLTGLNKTFFCLLNISSKI